MEKHTPLPWKISKNGDSIINQDNFVIVKTIKLSGPNFDFEGIANIKFIVQTCNSHAALLAACKLIDDRFETARKAKVESITLALDGVAHREIKRLLNEK